VTPDSWLERRVLVCVGTGGVGKTTVAAALGLEAARRGQRVLVLTIDPARRLADALGAGPLDHEERPVPREWLRRAGVPDRGALSATMLDTKRTFDEIVARHAPDAETVERIYANPIYQNLTDALAGSREYSAIEKLHQVVASGRYDLVVLDTPPAHHALEFLDAPRRLIGFLDAQLLRLLFRPAAAMGRVGFRLFRLGSATVLRTIERISGIEFLTAVSEFLLVFEAMLDGFSARAREAQALLRGRDCGFVLVAGPGAEQARRARGFFARLEAEQVEVVGLIVNRVRTWAGKGPLPSGEPGPEAERWLAGALASHGLGSDPRAAAAMILAAGQRQAALAARDAEVVRALAADLPLERDALRVVPLLDEDVHALDGLARLGARVFGKSDP
jgi:anion-transporting  ArsA/GET3 family ATPase